MIDKNFFTAKRKHDQLYKYSSRQAVLFISSLIRIFKGEQILFISFKVHFGSDPVKRAVYQECVFVLHVRYGMVWYGTTATCRALSVINNIGCCTNVKRDRCMMAQFDSFFFSAHGETRSQCEFLLPFRGLRAEQRESPAVGFFDTRRSGLRTANVTYMT